MGLFRKKSAESPPEETGDATTEATDGMKICDGLWGSSCGDEFDEAAARKRFNRKFNDYDDLTEHSNLCFRCAALEAESLSAQGLAIMMMSGDEDYDEDHVEEWL